MTKVLGAALSLLMVLALTACGGGKGAPKAPVEIIVSAAASMTDALKEAQTLFEAEHKATTITFNFGSSGALQQQIEQGAPADLFISAAKGPMDHLVKKGLVAEQAVTNVVSNKVVLIRAKNGPDVVKDWDDLKGAHVKRVAIGNPQHVPVGQYAKTVLEKLELWGAVEPRLVLGEDVRQVLNYVESGEVEAGIVYSTDAAVSQKVLVIAEAPAGSHAPVIYPMAVLKESKHGAQAKAFADFLLSDKGRETLSKYGFGPGN